MYRVPLPVRYRKTKIKLIVVYKVYAVILEEMVWPISFHKIQSGKFE